MWTSNCHSFWAFDINFVHFCYFFQFSVLCRKCRCNIFFHLLCVCMSITLSNPIECFQHSSRHTFDFSVCVFLNWVLHSNQYHHCSVWMGMNNICGFLLKSIRNKVFGISMDVINRRKKKQTFIMRINVAEIDLLQQIKMFWTLGLLYNSIFSSNYRRKNLTR